MKKKILTTCASLTLALSMVSGIIGLGGVSELGDVMNDNSSIFGSAVISVSAKEYTTPQMSFKNVYADVIKVSVDNYKSMKGSPDIYVYVDGKYVKKMKYKTLKSAKGKINIYSNGSKKLKASTKYKVKLTAVYSDGTKQSKTKSATTPTGSYWTVHKGVSVFSRSGGKFVKAFTLDKDSVYKGTAVDKNCKKIAGKAKSKTARYLKITVPVENGKNSLGEMQYKNKTYYVDYKMDKKINRKSLDSVRNKVVNYAVSMTKKPNQTYQLSGEYVSGNTTVSDCSGLAELSYLQIGYYLEHYSDAQANNYGKKVYNNTVPAGDEGGTPIYTKKNANSRVDYSKLKKGDLVFFLCQNNSQTDNSQYTTSLGLGHVGMYIGDGKMAHFTAGYGIYNHPCRIEDLAAYEKTQLPVAVAVRYIY